MHTLWHSNMDTAKSVAELFVKEIVRLHGYPRSIVSDQDRVWNELFKLVGTRLHRSSATNRWPNRGGEQKGRSLSQVF